MHFLRSSSLCILVLFGCQRTKPYEDWEVFLSVVRPGGGRLAPPADPDAPVRLRLSASGPMGDPLVFLQDRGNWILLDAEARQVFSTAAPAAQDDTQPARVAAAFYSAAHRSVFVLYQQDLHAIPLDKPRVRSVASLGPGALCAFAPPFEQHLLQEGDFGEDPDRKTLCAVLRDTPEPDTHRACTVAVNPGDGTVKTACVKDVGRQAGRPVEAPTCAIQVPLNHPPAASGWSPDEAKCEIRQESTGRVVPLMPDLMPDSDEPLTCRIRFEGTSANGRFAIWCTSDPEPEYAGKRCRVVDLQRAHLLEPAVNLPVETHVRWDGSARAVLMGEFLFLLNRSPTRFVELNATVIFVQ